MGNSSSDESEGKGAQSQEREKPRGTPARRPDVQRRQRRRHTMSKQNPQRFLQVGNISVSVIKGNIIDQTTDVIVNSAVNDLNLSKGTASRALLKAGGDVIQADCNRKYPSGITHNDVAITTSGNLKCKAIYHVTLPRWQNQGDEKHLQHVVQRCLAEADQYGSSSLAFPALGTGYLKYPTKTVVSSMFNTIETFTRNKPNSSIKVVNCVIFYEDETIFKDFLNEARSRAASRGLQEKELVVRTSLNTRIENININITVGSIITERADVIINSCPTDMKLDTRPGYAKVISDAAGRSLQEEINQKYPKGLKYGELAVTAGYSLHCKEVFHGCLTSFFAKREGGLLPEQVLYNFVKNCLQEASKRSHRTMALPALGTGYVRFPPKTAASKVITAIKDFQANNPASSLNTIHIVIFGGTNDWTSIEQAYLSHLDNAKKPQVTATKVLDIPKRGTREYLAYKYNEDARSPVYWTNFKSEKTIKVHNAMNKGDPCAEIDIHPQSQTFKSISAAFKKTLDAQIVSIKRIENILLFEQYTQECQRTFRKAYVNEVCTPLKDVPQSKGVASTMTDLNRDMVDCLHAEINEMYLFHGTKVNKVEVIKQQGLDDRLAASGLLGTGVYTADTAKKSASYADQNAQGESKMFLMRVCLGDIFITTTSNKYKRPPCKQCYTDTCTTHPDLFDSVVAEFGMREFVVYDRTKCFPEYLITYR